MAERGQFVNTPHDYEILAKAEWVNVYESLQRAQSYGNEKLPLLKLTVKTGVMTHF
jgi:hypothetical protein